MACADQRSQAQRLGKGAAGKPRPTQGIADRLRRARDRTAQDPGGIAVLRQSASGAAVSVELLAIAGRARPIHIIVPRAQLTVGV